MKKLYMALVSLATVVLAAGCIEDKGNYDYSDVNELTLTLDKTSVSVSMGETIEVNSTISFLNGKGDAERLIYKWSLYNSGYTQPDWNTPNFRWTPDKTYNNEVLLLEITDPVTGLQFLNRALCNVTSIYDSDGILVLSEKDGHTQFSFVKFPSSSQQLYEGNFSAPFSLVEYIDAYTVDNKEELPAEPLKLSIHSCTDTSTRPQILAMTKNGAVDINGKDFQKELVLAGEFEGGAYPAGMDYAAQAQFMSLVDLVTDSQGHIYGRLKNTPELFHSGQFLPTRLSFEGEELSGCQLIAAPYSSFQACLVYDSNKKRMLLIGDGGTYGKPLSIMALKDPSTLPAGFVSLEDMSSVNVLWVGYFEAKLGYGSPGYNDGMWDVNYTIVFEKNGEVYCQEFFVAKDISGGAKFNHYVYNPLVSKISGITGTPDCVASSVYKWDNGALFLSVGRKLYVYDRMNPTKAAVECDNFRSEIVAMKVGAFKGRWLTVALADGSVLLLNAVKREFAKNRYVYYDSKREIQKMPPHREPDGTYTEWENNVGDPVEFGTVVDIHFK